jgi:hypothetical protein
MSEYAQQLRSLQEAMLWQKEDVALGIAAHHTAFPVTERLGVYIYGYQQRMYDAVKVDFPALQHLLGAEAYHTLINSYVHSTASRYWDLNRYPLALPQFMNAQGMPADACALATLEATITDVFWSATSAPVTHDMLATLDEEAFGAIRVQLRRDVRLLHLEYDAESYLAAFRANTPMSEVVPQHSYLLLLRHQHEVVRLRVERLHFTVLQQFHAPTSFNDAFHAIHNAEQLADYLPDYMTQWLEYGILSSEV